MVATVEKKEVDLNRLSASLLGALVFSAAVVSAATPVFALGGCGPNRHRNYYGFCVYGGQRENYCLRRTGHYATRMPDGTLRCF